MFFPILGSRFSMRRGHQDQPPPEERRWVTGLGVSPRYTRDCGRGTLGLWSPHVCP